MSCLSEETIIAFVGARLRPQDVERVEAHTGSCAACRELLSLAIQAAPAPNISDRLILDSPESTLAAPPPDDGVLARGTAFGRYSVLGPIGRGAMGEVYAAYDPELDRKVALKILHARGDTPDGRSRSRLLREAKAIAKLRHPNVVVVHDAGSVEGRVFLAMEYVDGQTLGAWLGERTRSQREILDVFVGAGRGLGAAHAAGLVHRDFKPQNVMVGKDGSVRVTDFGLARQIGAPAAAPEASDDDAAVHAGGAAPPQSNDAAIPITRTGELIGTPMYMAPEQLKTRWADARTDQFSFCVALYQALYGMHPFFGGKLVDITAAVAAGRVQPPPPKSTVPPWLRRILLRGLSVDPAARWESMEALTLALARDPARQRRRWLGAVALLVALIAGVVAVRAPRSAESMCRGGADRLAGIWETAAEPPSRGSRRAATRAAFERLGGAVAVGSWERAGRPLDRYAAAWVRMYEDACVATNVRGEQSAEVLDLRMACLQEQLGRVKALTTVFLEPNGTVIENAVAAAGALPTLDRCADVNLLRAVMPPPDEPKARERLEALRPELARVRALATSGQCSAAATAERKLIADAEALGYLPFLVDSLLATFRSPGCAHENILQNAKRAVLIGLKSHHHEAAAEAAIHLGQAMADDTANAGRARDWLDVGSAIMEGMGNANPQLESWRVQALAIVNAKEGNSEKAFEAFKQALALIEKVQGVDHADYANIHNNIGVFLLESGRYDEALTYLERAARLAAGSIGPEHSVVALSVFNSAEALNRLHRYNEARSAAERALAIWRRNGASPYFVAAALTMLGEALVGQGNSREAAARAAEAVQLYGNDLSTSYPHEARFVLARALWSSPADRPRALELAREAGAGYRRAGKLPADVAKVDAWLQEHSDGKRHHPK
jgi:tetratricopeptide (TPR) repeat protein